MKAFRRALVTAPLLLVLGSCASSSVIGMESMMRPTPSRPPPSETPGRVHLTGTFVKLTGFPCHRSDPYGGSETVAFGGCGGRRPTIVTGSAYWIGLGAARRSALVQGRQVAEYMVDLN